MLTEFQKQMIAERYLHINTIGCQMNVYDSERIASLMAADGYRLTDEIEAADLIVVNTCAIREKAEQKAFSFLGRLAALKRKKPELIIAAGGCVAQQEGERIFKRTPFVDLVFGTQAVGRLPDMVASVRDRRRRVVDVGMAEGPERFDAPLPEGRSAEVTRFVTIMQGCDNYCTYCVVPYVRGREASREPEDILSEICGLVDCGVREVTLLGQNVNSYGIKEGLCSFAELLRRIDGIEGLYRIRFTTSHPKDISSQLVEAFAEVPKLCGHIHLPVQSGSDAVLKRMNRKYTRADYLEKVEALRRTRPDIAITSDMIVGFPGETEADFEMTLDLMETVGFDGLFAFMYSDRPNAPAARFDRKVPDAEKERRLDILLKRQSGITHRKNLELVGTVQEVLVEGTSKRHDDDANAHVEAVAQWRGRTEGNKIINFTLNGADEAGIDGDLNGRMARVAIEEAFVHSLRGRGAVDESFSEKRRV